MKKKLKKIDRVVRGLSDRYFPAAFAISEDLTKKLNLPRCSCGLCSMQDVQGFKDTARDSRCGRHYRVNFKAEKEGIGEYP